MQTSATDFKAHCLEYMDRTQRTREEIIITKHNKPVAKLVPISEEKVSFVGYMKGSGVTVGDIVSPIEDIEWDAMTS